MQAHGRLFTAFAAGLVAVGAHAHAQSTQATAPSSSDTRTVVTGCIERADQLTSRDALGTTVDSLTFVLIKAEEGTAQTTAVGTSGNTGTSEAQPGLGRIYRLEGTEEMLNEHVGHRVEVSGTVVQQPAAGASPAATATGGTADAAASGLSAGRAPLLRAASVKLVSETCPRQ